ncbi:MAG: ABC transporter permease [Acidobacteria bacterium]|nr:ABC transporter permease [Acidobacteriota bacterium]
MYLQDLRYGVRMLARNPGFAAVAALTLALGIGVNTAIFSVVNAALLRPLPYRASDRLVMLWDQLLKLGLTQFPTTFGTYLDYKNQNQVFDDIAVYNTADVNLTGGEQPERISAGRASANLWPLLGVDTALGRTFTPEENQPGRGSVAVISHGLWQRRFGADPQLAGKTLNLDGALFTAIGVLPPGFAFSAGLAAPPDLWLPLEFRPDPNRTRGNLRLIARLRTGVSLAHAQSNMTAVGQRLAEEHRLYRGPRGEDAGYRVRVTPLREQLYGDMRRGLLVLLGAVGFVLLIACLNIAHLLLARAAGRRREIAIRRALGAGPARLAGQLLGEGLPLAALGGCGGLLAGWWGVDFLTALSPRPLPPIGFDPAVFGYTALLSLATELLFGLAPALEGSRGELNETLKEGGRGAAGQSRNRLAQTLVAAEVALSLILAAGAGLLIQSLVRLLQVPPGFDARQLQTLRISLPPSRYSQNHLVTGFFEELLRRIESMPGAEAASMAARLPLSGGRGGDPFSIEGRPYDTASRTPQVANAQAIGDGYFRAMRIPLLAGRCFAERDDASAPPRAIVNETLARGFWAGGAGEALGKRILMGAPRPGAPWMTIVGVAGDVRESGLDVAPIPQVYTPHRQTPARTMTLVIRAGPEAVSGVARQVSALDAGQPVYDVKTMEQRIQAGVAQPRFQTLLLGLFAALALLLAAVGIYGVVSYGVARRAAEIGVRMALGASPAGILRLVLGQAMLPVIAGLAAGLGGAFALRDSLAGMVYGIGAGDPGTLAAASLLIAAVALMACIIPARRAAGIDPMAALRGP